MYVIGGLVDQEIKTNATLGVAKKQGIRHAHLPLRRVIGMQCILNVETMMAILCDYRLTRDWLYSFRHVSPRVFKGRLKGSPFTSREEAVYFAQHKLHPGGQGMFGNNMMIGPTAYRQKYMEILMAAPKDRTLHDPEKYKSKTPKYLKGLKGRLHKRNLENYV